MAAFGCSVTDDIEKYYDFVVQRYPRLKEAQPVDSYLGYLESANLVSRTSGRVTLTVAGREFLKWLIEAGKPDRGIY